MRTGPFILCSSVALLVSCGEFGEGPAPKTDKPWVSPQLATAMKTRNTDGSTTPNRKMYLLDENPDDAVQKVMILNPDGSPLLQSPDAPFALASATTPRQEENNPFKLFMNLFSAEPAQPTVTAADPVQVASTQSVDAPLASEPVAAPQATDAAPQAGVDWAAVFAPKKPEPVAPAVATVAPKVVTPEPVAPAQIASVQAEEVVAEPAPPRNEFNWNDLFSGISGDSGANTQPVAQGDAEEPIEQVETVKAESTQAPASDGGGVSLTASAPATGELVVVDPQGKVVAGGRFAVEGEEAEVAPDASATTTTETAGTQSGNGFSWAEIFAPANSGSTQDSEAVAAVQEPAEVVVEETEVLVTETPAAETTTAQTQSGQGGQGGIKWGEIFAPLAAPPPATPSTPATSSTSATASAPAEEEPKTQIASVDQEQPSLIENLSNLAGGSSSSDIDQNWRNKLASLEFSNGKLVGETACATFSAKYAKVSGNRVRISGLKSTPKSCSADQAKAESDNFVNSLPGTYDVIIDGSSMLLRGGSAVYQFSNI